MFFVSPFGIVTLEPKEEFEPEVVMPVGVSALALNETLPLCLMFVSFPFPFVLFCLMSTRTERRE